MRWVCVAMALCAMGGCAEMRQTTGSTLQFRSEASSPADRHEGDIQTIMSGWGLVRGRPEALAGFPQPLPAVRGRNRTVEPCRQAVERVSAPAGAISVEAASRGPHRRTLRGNYVGPVEVRVVYSTGSALVVRQASLRCVTRPNGRFVTARALNPAPLGS